MHECLSSVFFSRYFFIFFFHRSRRAMYRLNHVKNRSPHLTPPMLPISNRNNLLLSFSLHRLLLSSSLRKNFPPRRRAYVAATTRHLKTYHLHIVIRCTIVDNGSFRSARVYRLRNRLNGWPHRRREIFQILPLRVDHFLRRKIRRCGKKNLYNIKNRINRTRFAPPYYARTSHRRTSFRIIYTHFLLAGGSHSNTPARVIPSYT